jgi:hypothetical protein
MDKNLYVPQEISIYGVITAHIFLITSFISKIKGFDKFVYLSFLLYISTILHWYKLKDKGIRKYFDMIIVAITLSYFTFIETKKLKDKHKILWYITSLIIILVYVTNIIIFRKQIVNESNDTMELEDYKYFSLRYTKPNTEVRKKACKINVFVHLLFLHLLPGFVCIFCLLQSNNS